MGASFILADCNNFFVSCERLFRPQLEGKPVIVLSNNDGCVVARSQEAKLLGIKMGEPYFTIRQKCHSYEVFVFSSNFLLYKDISNRIMKLLSQFSEEIEVYSIDEAFLKFNGKSKEGLLLECMELKKQIQKRIGIPLSFGIAPTKTLAKVAADLAKKKPSGVFELSSSTLQKNILSTYPLGDVWGIGSRSKEKLKILKMHTALDFIKAPSLMIRNKFGVVGEKIYLELKGISCLPIEKPSPKKSITCSRSFATATSDLKFMKEALATFTVVAAARMRKQNSYAKSLLVFVESVLDKQTGSRRHDCLTTSFIEPTNDSSRLIFAASYCLERLFDQGLMYKKCGVILLDLIDESAKLPDLFLDQDNRKKKSLSSILDHVNARFGKNALYFGSMGHGLKKHIPLENRPAFEDLTCWKGLPIVYAR